MIKAVVGSRKDLLARFLLSMKPISSTRAIFTLSTLLLSSPQATAWVTNTSHRSSHRLSTKSIMSGSSSSSNSAKSSTASDAAETTTSTEPLAAIRKALDNSWIAQLSPETPENLAKSKDKAGTIDDTNRSKRPVLNGHYVLVRPTGLQKPTLLLTSESVAHDWLKMTDDQLNSDDFVQWVSGNLHLGDSWATPYALSIMGTRYTHK